MIRNSRWRTPSRLAPMSYRRAISPLVWVIDWGLALYRLPPRIVFMCIAAGWLQRAGVWCAGKREYAYSGLVVGVLWVLIGHLSGPSSWPGWTRAEEGRWFRGDTQPPRLGRPGVGCW